MRQCVSKGFFFSQLKSNEFSGAGETESKECWSILYHLRIFCSHYLYNFCRFSGFYDEILTQKRGIILREPNVFVPSCMNCVFGTCAFVTVVQHTVPKTHRPETNSWRRTSFHSQPGTGFTNEELHAFGLVKIWESKPKWGFSDSQKWLHTNCTDIFCSKFYGFAVHFIYSVWPSGTVSLPPDRNNETHCTAQTHLDSSLSLHIFLIILQLM